MSSAPILAPHRAPLPPTAPSRKRRSWAVYVVIAIVILLGAVYWIGQRNSARRRAAATSSAAIRTATIRQGTLEQTIRLTGTTAARQFVMLITPTLRGSRGGGWRDARVASSGVNTNIVVNSNNKTGSSSSSASSGANALSGVSSSTDSNAGPASTANQTGTGLSGALQSSTSRVNVGTSSSTGNIGAGSSNTPVSNSNLGSTSGQLISTGGGGGGGDFGLTLQKLAAPGSHAKKGQIVAEFDRQYMLLRLDDYRATVIQNEAGVKRMKAELEVGRKAHTQQVESAKADLDKARLDLKATPVLGVMDTERLKLAYEEADAKYKELLSETKFVEMGQAAQLKNAELDLAEARVELKRAEMNADRMLLKSSIDGLVVIQQTYRGSEFSPIKEGDQLFPGQPVMQVVDTSGLIVNATVNQADVESLRIGQPARIQFDAYPDLKMTGRVYSIAAITKAGGMRAAFVKEIPVQIRLDTTDPRIVPDLSVSVDVVVASAANATIAPRNAVFGNGSPDAPAVYVKRDYGWEKRTVRLGLKSNLGVAIEEGLSAGDVVAIMKPPPGAEGI